MFIENYLLVLWTLLVFVYGFIFGKLYRKFVKKVEAKEELHKLESKVVEQFLDITELKNQNKNLNKIIVELEEEKIAKGSVK